MIEWTEIPIEGLKTNAQIEMAIRLNSLGSLYYFIKHTLQRNQLTPDFHGYLCRQFERDSMHLVLEIPRDHLKTTCGSEGAPMWWALPFSEKDETLMRACGYGDEWIRWMKRAHNSRTRTLIASEVIGNARKIGRRIDGHYSSNTLFRRIFPEIIPKSVGFVGKGRQKKSSWNQDSMTHQRPPGPTEGEGTYDFIGVKGALQSRHYDRIIEDDLVGEKAVYSDTVMESTIEWHKKLPGALTHREGNPDLLGDQIIIGNRWSHRDLNSHIRANEPHYEIHNHDAEGGCCLMHPEHGKPIFPEAFSMEKLAIIKQTEGSYNYSAHYRNNPVDPEACRFKSKWLPRYGFDIVDGNKIAGIRHETQAGVVLPDISLNALNRVAILDVNHSGESGRCRHAILVAGYLPRQQDRPPRIYMLEVWAKASPFDEMIETLIGKNGLAQKWKCHHLYVETVAGQDGWYYVFQNKMKQLGMDASFTVRKLVTDRSAGGKMRRIEGMEPVYENGMFCIPRQGRGVDEFLEEYEKYPNGKTIDILDVAGYVPQTMQLTSYGNAKKFISSENRKHYSAMQSVGVCGY